jgi:hypothetical protein
MALVISQVAMGQAAIGSLIFIAGTKLPVENPSQRRKGSLGMILPHFLATLLLPTPEQRILLAWLRHA